MTKANEQIREIKQKFKKDLLIETFPSVPEGKEEEATSKDLDVKKRFFATWARQRARDARITGIYVLITRKPGHIQVEVGNNTEKVFPRTDRDRLAKMLIDYFKKEDYDKGLLEGIRFVRSILQENKGALSHAAVHEDDFGPTQVAKEKPRSQPYSEKSRVLFWAGGGALHWAGGGGSSLGGLRGDPGPQRRYERRLRRRLRSGWRRLRSGWRRRRILFLHAGRTLWRRGRNVDVQQLLRRTCRSQYGRLRNRGRRNQYQPGRYGLFWFRRGF